MKQQDLGITKVKSEISDMVNSINQELITIDHTIEGVKKFSEEESDSLPALTSDSKFKRFLHGLCVIQRILEKLAHSCQVAVWQDVDEVSIEIESLKLEVDGCLEQLKYKIESLSEIDETIRRTLITITPK